MRPTFVDTAAWEELIDARDQLHHQAKVVLETLGREKSPLVTTELVLVEVGGSLSQPATRSNASRFVEGLRMNPSITIVAAEPAPLADAWQLFSQRPDKSWSLTDCFSFVVMNRAGSVRAFTSDHHFEQAGFQRLLSPPW